jgi:hypothetical protein
VTADGSAGEASGICVEDLRRLKLCVYCGTGEGDVCAITTNHSKGGSSGGRTMGGDFLPVHHRGPAIGPPWTRRVTHLANTYTRLISTARRYGVK